MIDIGIRGDCVYVIYTVSNNVFLNYVCNLVCYCNTCINMLNKLFYKYKLPILEVGIGMGVSNALIIKVGRRYVNINDKIWIGDAIIDASNLASKSNKNGLVPILVSEKVFYGLDDESKKFFNFHKGGFYSANIIISNFNEWIKGGMVD